MELDIDDLMNLGFAIFFGILLILFAYQTIRKKRSAPHFLILLSFGMIGGLFAFLNSSRIFPDPLRLFLTIQLMCYGFQFFFFYLFMEELVGIKVQPIRFGLAFGLLILQNVSLWVITNYRVIGGNTDLLWLLADIGYDGLALFTVWGCAIPVYLQMFRYTKEKKPIFFGLAMFIVGLGFLIILLIDFIGYFGIVPDWLNAINILGDVFPLLGLMLFLIGYLSNIDYIYRLAHDNYILMVTYKSGITVHSVNFENQSGISVEENLISGLLTTINMIFSNVLKAKSHIETIASKDATIYMTSGKYITTTILTQHTSAILARAMTRYTQEFETRYKQLLEKNESDTSQFDNATELLSSVFPFLIIKKLE
jgi:hypothetical protein